MVDAHPPLRWQQSAESHNPAVSDKLPEEVVHCLQNARFLHLATCTANIPHVSLMNYTYLPSHPFPSTSSASLPDGPLIIMTSNPSSKKTLNLLENHNVSLLVHDWVSSRPPQAASSGDRERSPAGAPRSSLADMLMSMNSAAVSSISATLNGSATVLESGTEEERWCKEQHLANNTFEGQAGEETVFGAGDGDMGDGGRRGYIEDRDVKVVVVRIRDGRISDWKGAVKDWVLEAPTGSSNNGSVANMVNGDVAAH